MGILDNKVAVITGSSRGIGFAIASALAQQGAAVVITSRSAESVNKAVDTIKSSGGKASGMPSTVCQLDQVYALADHALQVFGQLDIWINNAGISGPYGPMTGMAPEDFYDVIHTNIIGVYNGSRVAMQHFQKQRSGKLVNLVGHGANGPVPYQTAYGASKAWVRNFTMAVAGETKGSGVGVFAFQPGMVHTDLLTHGEVVSGYEDKLKSFPRVIQILAKMPEAAARKMVWVVSPATDGKTGKLYTAQTMGIALHNLVAAFLGRLPLPEVRIKSVPSWEERRN
jgi:glucose 1-dehydrogenase